MITGMRNQVLRDGNARPGHLMQAKALRIYLRRPDVHNSFPFGERG